MSAIASNFKVMSFNTMCDFCGRDGFDNFDSRKKSIKSIIETEKADLVSLQEVRSGSQVEYFFSDSKNYELIFYNNFLLSYADPALAINKDRFKILTKGQFWLGPKKGEFSIGWKYAIPRLVQWVKLEDKIKKQKLVFIGTHFDNRVENMVGSAQMVNEFIQDQKVPVIFAGDTNCTVDFKGYAKLTKSQLINSYDQHSETRNIASSTDNKNLCYLRKGKTFPECRVDHILYSKDSPWKVNNWSVNTYKAEGALNFPSDHRPVSAIFTY